MTNKFAVTFGQKFNHEEHQKLPGVRAKSFLTIEAMDEQDAREQLLIALGDAYHGRSQYPVGDYAFIYSWEEFEPQIEAYKLVEVSFTLHRGALGVMKWWLRMPGGEASIGDVRTVTRESLEKAEEWSTE